MVEAVDKFPACELQLLVDIVTQYSNAFEGARSQSSKVCGLKKRLHLPHSPPPSLPLHQLGFSGCLLAC